MSINRGVVHGKIIVLLPDAPFADGSVVEVRLAQPAPETVPDDAADRQVQTTLIAAGLLQRVHPLGAQSAVVERPLLQVAGPPVSETISAERR